MDYSKSVGRLFSASDDGKVFLWGLNAGKLVQKYENFDQTGYINGTAPKDGYYRDHRFTYDQVAHSMEISGMNSCPTALGCSNAGDIAFIAYTDDSLHMHDVRTPENKGLFKSGGHTGMIKSIWVSDDQSMVFTGGSDGTVRVWDVGTRTVI